MSSSPSPSPAGVDIPKITYDELVAILSLDMTMDALLETPSDAIADAFHTNWDVSAPSHCLSVCRFIVIVLFDNILT